MRIFQKNNYITIDFLNKKSEIYSLHEENEELDKNSALFLEKVEFKDKKKKISLQTPPVSNDNALKCELKSFAESVLSDKNVKVNAIDGKNALRVVLDIINKIKR